MVRRLRERSDGIRRPVLCDVGRYARFYNCYNTLRRHNECNMRAVRLLRVIVCAFGTVAVAAACLRASPPEGAAIDAGDAGLPDAADRSDFDAAPALRYHYGCQYCPVACDRTRKTCAELGISPYDPCFVVAETNERRFGADGPTESCVWRLLQRRESDASDGGDGGCTVIEEYLSCLPDPGRSIGDGVGSCGGGGVPCQPPR